MTAQDVIAEALDSMPADPRPTVLVNRDRAQVALDALATAGYAVAELPEPYATGVQPGGAFALWSSGHPDGAMSHAGRVEITRTVVPDERGYTPGEARDLAAALLAAASHAEAGERRG